MTDSKTSAKPGKLNRRQLLGMGCGLAAGSLLPFKGALAAYSDARSLSFEHLHTGEQLSAVYWSQGRFNPGGLSELRHIMRDWRTGDTVEIDRELYVLLHEIRQRIGTDAPYQLISAYRSPMTNNSLRSKSSGVAKKSLHMQGMAVDVESRRPSLANVIGGLSGPAIRPVAVRGLLGTSRVWCPKPAAVRLLRMWAGFRFKYRYESQRLCRRTLCLLALLALRPFLTDPAAAQEIEVDLELVLAVDISRSMDLEEQQLQRSGYSEAIRHPEVIEAIENGLLGRIAVIYVEWAGPGRERIIEDWRIIDSKESAVALSEDLLWGELTALRGTSITSALAFSQRLFEGNGYSGLRRVIDISGDGRTTPGDL